MVANLKNNFCCTINISKYKIFVKNEKLNIYYKMKYISLHKNVDNCVGCSQLYEPWESLQWLKQRGWANQHLKQW